jgi:ABC-type sugar transport system ATPase subunit
VLAPRRSTQLFAGLEALKAEGLSGGDHHPQAGRSRAIADRLTVLRGGKLIRLRLAGGPHRPGLIEAMVGRRRRPAVAAAHRRRRRRAGAAIVACRCVTAGVLLSRASTWSAPAR